MGSIYTPDELEDKVEEKADDQDKYPYEVIEDALSDDDGLSDLEKEEAREIAEDVVESYRR